MAGAVDAHELQGVAGTLPPAPWIARAAAVPPPLIALGFGSAAVALHLTVWGEAARFGLPMQIGVPVGALLGGAGLAMIAWSLLLFRAAGNPIPPRRQPRLLIEEGPYRYSRHPMYLGIVVMQLGVSSALGMPLLVVSALGFFAVVARVHVPHEEAQLLARFGGWYRDYAGSTRRWL